MDSWQGPSISAISRFCCGVRLERMVMICVEVKFGMIFGGFGLVIDVDHNCHSNGFWTDVHSHRSVFSRYKSNHVAGFGSG